LIKGYPERASVAAGGRLVLHVATDASRFRVRFLRCGADLTVCETSGWLSGIPADERTAGMAWDWPSYPFTIPKSWPSGAYIAQLVEAKARTITPNLGDTQGALLFVVRGERRARMLYKIPLATYHAYNYEGHGCYYADSPRSADPPGSRVTLHRPGGGIGGETFGAVDFYDRSSARQTFAHWDARFIRWLAAHEYDVEFCTDFDLHDDAARVDGYKLLLNVGHDEYWSEAMRDAVERFISRGGNVAFFGANICWWRIHVLDNGRTMLCHQGGPRGALDHWWSPTGVHRPEDALTGVSYRHGGGWWDGARSTEGFFVQDASHWAFADTGLRDGDAFGRDTWPPLVGYECDGAPLETFDTRTSRAALASIREPVGTPENLSLLAAAPLSKQWNELPPRERFGAGEGIHAATMCVYERNGTVFTAATTDWAQVLDYDRTVEAITRNVIERLAR
jgi:hypothetical protein